VDRKSRLERKRETEIDTERLELPKNKNKQANKQSPRRNTMKVKREELRH
jgi:hypothetical protein